MSFLLRLTLVLWGFASMVSAAENPIAAKHMLESMKNAMDSLSYQGTVALYKNGKLDTMQLTHAVNGGIEQERLKSLNSPMREIVMDQEQIRCEFHDSKETVVMLWPSRQAFFPDLPANLDSLDGYYQFNLKGTAVIANQQTNVIEIEPKDDYRYRRKIWLNQENYLPLKFILFDHAGMALEQVMFSDLQLLDPAQIKLDSQPVSSKKNDETVYQFKALPFDDAGFVLTKVPAGFKKLFLTRRTMRGKEKLIDHMLLSDGFASVSVYFEEVEQDFQGNEKLFAEQHAVGAVNSYSRPLSRYLLTVMGEVPKKTVKLIAEGAMIRTAQ